jgi:lambda family phage portal protein
MWPFKTKEKEKPKQQRSRGISQRTFEAAIRDRTHNWNVTPEEIDKDIRYSLADLRTVSRDLEQNNDYIKRYLNLLKTHIVGPKGVTLQASFKKPNGELDEEVNGTIEREFSRWSERPEVTGRMTLPEVERLIISSVARDGEALVRLVYGSKNQYGIALQLIDPVALDVSLNQEYADGREIKMGVEVSEWGEPLAYYLKTSRRGPGAVVIDGTDYVRVPAEEMIHVFRPDRVGQTRGFPWIHTSIRRLKMLQGYEQAELVAARVASSKMGFFTRQPGTDSSYEGEGQEHDSGGNIITDAKPGSFELLPEGVEFRPWTPEHPSGNYSAFVKTTLRGIAAGLGGISYNTLANDLESVNFSSLRQGLLEERSFYMTVQEWFIDGFMKPLYGKWLRASVLSGKIVIPSKKLDDYMMPGFIPRRWSWVDPLKDVKAAIAAIDAGLKSRSEVIAEQGRSIEDVLAELKREELLAVSLGLEPKAAADAPRNPGQPSNASEGV